MAEIELPTIVGNAGETNLEEEKVERKLRPASITSLFLRFSSKKEVICLLGGFICAVSSVH